eukprot:8369062-Pyramimonas_sp.AAC.1
MGEEHRRPTEKAAKCTQAVPKRFCALCNRRGSRRPAAVTEASSMSTGARMSSTPPPIRWKTWRGLNQSTRPDLGRGSIFAPLSRRS